MSLRDKQFVLSKGMLARRTVLRCAKARLQARRERDARWWLSCTLIFWLRDAQIHGPRWDGRGAALRIAALGEGAGLLRGGAGFLDKENRVPGRILAFHDFDEAVVHDGRMGDLELV